MSTGDKRKYNIGVDLDSTLIETKVVEHASKELGYDFDNQDMLSWMGAGGNLHFPDDLRERIMQYFVDPFHMCDNASPIEKSQETIKKWNEEGHTIILITARVESLKDHTIAMVNRLFPEIKDIHVVGMDQSKKSIMLSKNIDFWIDDAPHGVLDSISIGIPTYLVSNNYTKYNWNVKDHPELKGVVKIIADIEFHQEIAKKEDI